jgi:hypothetical protein
MTHTKTTTRRPDVIGLLDKILPSTCGVEEGQEVGPGSCQDFRGGARGSCGIGGPRFGAFVMNAQILAVTCLASNLPGRPPWPGSHCRVPTRPVVGRGLAVAFTEYLASDNAGLDSIALGFIFLRFGARPP